MAGLQDDARRLLNEMDPTIDGMCVFCYGASPGPDQPTPHDPGCVYVRRAQIIAALEDAPSERTPDGHPQVWLLYRPEPFEFGGDDDRSIHLWVRRADVFTSRIVAMAFLDNLVGHQVQWRPYNELFPELWIAEDRGHRWLMVPAPVDPPGGQR